MDCPEFDECLDFYIQHQRPPNRKSLGEKHLCKSFGMYDFQFDQNLARFKRFVKNHNFPSMRNAKSLEELFLASWAKKQRFRYRNRFLDENQIFKLEGIPEWLEKGWDPEEEIFSKAVVKFTENPTQHEQKESYFLKQDLNEIYKDIDPDLFEELSRQVLGLSLDD